MKLRNKKTGKIKNVCLVMDKNKIAVVVANMPLCGNSVSGEYNSLAELNEEWEDAPAEPLIKDEKIRKAVRAWASSNEVKEVLFDEHWHSFRDVDMVISFLFSYRDFDCLEDGKTYTIAELCGEEEE
jgi:hypothetical protein